MEKEKTKPTAPRGLALLQAAWSAGFDVAICSICFHYGHCQLLNHHDVKLDPACDAFILAAPQVPLV